MDSEPKLKRARLQTVELSVNEEHSKSAGEQVTGYEEDTKETHHEGGRPERGSCNPKF